MAGREYAATTPPDSVIGSTTLQCRVELYLAGLPLHPAAQFLVRPRRRARARQHPRRRHGGGPAAPARRRRIRRVFVVPRRGAAPPAPRAAAARRLRQHHRRGGLRRRAERRAGDPAAAVAVREGAAGVAGPLGAAADGAIAERAADPGGGARSLRAPRREGDSARLDRAAELGLRHHRGAGLPHRRRARPRSGAGGVEDRRPRHRRRRRGAHPRAARRVDRLDSEVQRPGAERDDAVARGAEGLQHGHRHAPEDRRRPGDPVLFSSTRSSSIRTSRWRRRASGRSTPTCATSSRPRRT